MAPAGTVWIAWPAGWSDARDHVPAIWSAVKPREPVELDGEAGVVVALEQPAKRNTERANGTSKRTLSFMALGWSKVSASDSDRKRRIKPSGVAGSGHGAARLSTIRDAGAYITHDPRHFFGKAKAMISSLVTCEPVSPPPVLTTVMNCRPSAPR